MRLYHKPFSIGLKPVADKPWFEIDDERAAYLAEKDRLFAQDPTAVFLAEDETAEAQSEVFAAVAQFLVDLYPERYRRTDDGILVDGVDLVSMSAGVPALHAAARLVQDDLVMMRARYGAWRLVAGSVCFPSSWSLAEKFGRRLEDVHAPVPGFGAKSRNASVINRIFDNLQPNELMWRQNWGVYDTDAVRLPTTAHDRAARLESVTAENLVIRVERQTLCKLPVSGDILFGIRIYRDSLADIKKSSHKNEMLSDLAAHLEGLSQDELGYKELALARDHLLSLISG